MGRSLPCSEGKERARQGKERSVASLQQARPWGLPGALGVRAGMVAHWVRAQ